MNHDIIGDVHGQVDKLDALLRRLGYREHRGAWRHPDRTAVFVGDLVDRGPRQVETVDRVRRMVEAGAARCIMGNHEFNAIAWATPDPTAPGEYLRRHGSPGNFEQHRAFLAEVQDAPLHADIIGWFRSLPLWLELGGVRVVHACWSEPCMRQLEGRLGPGNTLTDDLLVQGSRKGSAEYAAIEAICKGLEVELPAGMSFNDKDGKARTSVRIRWWNRTLDSWRTAALAPRDVIAQLPDQPMPADPRVRVYDGPPVLFGHYWFSGRPDILARNVACVDYSAGKDGPLVAYRWEGEPELGTQGFWTHVE